MIARAFIHASVGDLDAMKFIMDRAIGKVPDKVEVKASIEVLPTREEAIRVLEADYAVLAPAKIEVEEL